MKPIDSKRGVEVSEPEQWLPGSFTKNFSWGGEDKGLRELHTLIRAGFDNALADVPRLLFRQRVAELNPPRPDYIPLNFFLYNRVKSGVDFVVADELVFQAVNFRHSANFDKLALFAFNLSRVGNWKKANAYQGRPALWAYHYIADRVGPLFDWHTRQVNADDIERFVSSDARYKAATSRKLATNLAYLYKQGRLSEYRSTRTERWWTSALFLALDRITQDIAATGHIPQEERYEEYLIRSGFPFLSGKRSIEKDLAAVQFTKLYVACGGFTRFTEDAVRERQRILLPHIQRFANNPEPVGAFHPSNPHARGAIPRACAMLARYAAHFEVVELDELETFDVEQYVRNRTREALDDLRQRQIVPTMSAEDLLHLTRGE